MDNESIKKNYTPEWSGLIVIAIGVLIVVVLKDESNFDIIGGIIAIVFGIWMTFLQDLLPFGSKNEEVDSDPNYDQLISCLNCNLVSGFYYDWEKGNACPLCGHNSFVEKDFPEINFPEINKTVKFLSELNEKCFSIDICFEFKKENSSYITLSKDNNSLWLSIGTNYGDETPHKELVRRLIEYSNQNNIEVNYTNKSSPKIDILKIVKEQNNIVPDLISNVLNTNTKVRYDLRPTESNLP